MFCKKCGSNIEDGDKFCPTCGAPVEAPEQPASGGAGKIDMDKMAGAASQAAENVAQKAQEFGEKGKNAWKKASGEGGILKKIFSGKNKIWLIGCAAVLVAAVLCIANGARLNNFLHRTFSSPEKYFQFVGKKALGDTADLIGDNYSNIVSEMELYDTSYSGTFTLEPGKKVANLIELAGAVSGANTGIDLSKLKSLTIGADVSIKDGVLGYGLTTALNKVSLLSANMVMDMEEGDVYLQIPELNKTYMGVDMEEILNVDKDDLADSQKANKELIQALPKQGEVEKLIKRYFILVLENIDDVEIGRKTELKVESISQKCTELDVTIDGDAMQEILEAVAEEAQEDKELEKIIVGVVEAMGEDGDDVYDDFVDALDEMLDDLDYYVDEDEEITLKLYVDRKGNIIGWSMEQEEWNGSYSTFSALSASKGSQVAYEITAESYGSEVFELSGQGKKSGDLLTGDFNVKVSGATVLEMTVTKLDMKQLKEGHLNGKAEIELSPALNMALNSALDITGASAIINDLSFVVDCKSSAKSVDCTVAVNDGKDMFLSMTLALKSGNGSKASVPKGKSVIMIEDADDFMDYYEGIEWEKFIDTLEKTDVLKGLARMLERSLDDLEDMLDYYL
ncbi:MAG: zinc ribbon domain-containing protein [Blautia sp.]|nr:zinc ribbon domain-containing protein [Blautia sp.]